MVRDRWTMGRTVRSQEYKSEQQPHLYTRGDFVEYKNDEEYKRKREREKINIIVEIKPALNYINQLEIREIHAMRWVGIGGEQSLVNINTILHHSLLYVI